MATILQSYASDKVISGLFEVYQNLWHAWRGQPIHLLEIGIDQGGSLRFWADFFHPQSVLVGLDLTPPQAVFPPCVRVVQGDQNDRRLLAQIAREAGPFDIVLDDGSHFARETRTCWETLWPAVKPGGWYVIEDWAVGYWRDQDPRYRGMVELVNELVLHVPEEKVAQCMVSLKSGQTYAAFCKGTEGWKA